MRDFYFRFRNIRVIFPHVESLFRRSVLTRQITIGVVSVSRGGLSHPRTVSARQNRFRLLRGTVMVLRASLYLLLSLYIYNHFIRLLVRLRRTPTNGNIQVLSSGGVKLTNLLIQARRLSTIMNLKIGKHIMTMINRRTLFTSSMITLRVDYETRDGAVSEVMGGGSHTNVRRNLLSNDVSSISTTFVLRCRKKRFMTNVNRHTRVCLRIFASLLSGINNTLNVGYMTIVYFRMTRPIVTSRVREPPAILPTTRCPSVGLRFSVYKGPCGITLFSFKLQHTRVNRNGLTKVPNTLNSPTYNYCTIDRI